ncbi:AraC family transcriptional regulator [Pollutibacter soli]|uniref:AraC family transcriptional regulator n=1 Tax=Pollutibacter soli TaxID=3034157 RepID=UPI0030139ACD
MPVFTVSVFCILFSVIHYLVFLQLTTQLYQRIAAAKQFIDENYDEPIDLEQISRKAFLSRFHFHRIFTQVYKKTPKQYLTKVRLDAAKELLAKEGLSITEVCNLIGFGSLGSFSTLFSKQSGYSPQYYRNIAWLKKRLVKEQPRRFVPHCFIEQFKVEGDLKAE